MGCGCGKNTATTTYVYVNEQGVAQQPTTEIQALAQKARAGGKGTVRPA